MQKQKKRFISSVLAGAIITACAVTQAYAKADALALTVEIPQLDTAEYHKPYVAVWLEDSARKSTQVALWYQIDKKNNEGLEWLKDLRQWWRRGGRSLDLPYDGFTSATKGPGTHEVSIDLSKADFKDLAPGNYKLRIEAVREVGGRENVVIPITLPLETSSLPISKTGKTELGKIRLSVQ
ncbi:DUF2271 domain-containing protein [uncultured Paraglaciecola sp.]|uniref:DUF2271 domain-containing protein n=1 Tax=uncultured Paraglaciecola sp. TaxID=1765024 RepID=UPI002597ACA1|nr:DUF2271 domain-containing protein [uncultured Paraglaciecola sp.]